MLCTRCQKPIHRAVRPAGAIIGRFPGHGKRCKRSIWCAPSKCRFLTPRCRGNVRIQWHFLVILDAPSAGCTAVDSRCLIPNAMRMDAVACARRDHGGSLGTLRRRLGAKRGRTLRPSRFSLLSKFPPQICHLPPAIRYLPFLQWPGFIFYRLLPPPRQMPERS
ncbi:MAG: hypothetical protein CM15mP103_08640 [Gammaproteobacteria bacterium]|nr:MAG: hypothetical protein CM15mP103_08640 [Gammaproteobacteria bacterium]